MAEGISSNCIKNDHVIKENSLENLSINNFSNSRDSFNFLISNSYFSIYANLFLVLICIRFHPINLTMHLQNQTFLIFLKLVIHLSSMNLMNWDLLHNLIIILFNLLKRKTIHGKTIIFNQFLMRSIQ